MAWTVTHTQDEATWLDDVIYDVIARELPPLPAHDVKIGHVEAHWHQVGPGIAFVAANPETGTPTDRRLVEAVVMEQLRPHGFKRAVYEMYHDLTRHSTWDDIMDKAKRLIQSGNVQLNRNGYDTVMARVKGDHGTYNVELTRKDPNSDKLTGQFCECDWGHFMNLPRTRQWKRFQNRSCAHCLATYWLSRSVPIDEERAPGNDPGQTGQMSLPGMDMSGGEAPSTMGIMRNSPSPNPNAWFTQPGAPPNPWNAPEMPQGGPQGQQGVAPTPEEVLPQFPMADQGMELPPVNPASVPGGRPGPTPTNPIQYPGETFSSYRPDNMSRMSDQQYAPSELVRLKQETVGQYVGRPESGMAGGSVTVPAGSVGEVLGTDPTTGLINVLFMGKQFNEMSYFEPFGSTAWCWPSEVTPSSNTPPGPAIRRT